MKLFSLSFSILLIFWGVRILKEPVHYSHRHGPQEAYQSIPAGIFLIGCALAFIVASKPHKNLRFPKTVEERKRRMYRVFGLLAAYVGMALFYTFIIPYRYDSPLDFHEIKEIPRAAGISFLVMGITFMPAFIFAYLLKEI